MAELKTCPKCRKREEITVCIIKFPKKHKNKYVKCFACGYETKRAFTLTGAMKNWNRRATV